MKFFLLPMINEVYWQNLSDSERSTKMAAYGAFIGALKAAGVPVEAHRPQPSAQVRTVRVNQEGVAQVQVGPKDNAPEQLAGLYIIDVASMDVALEWAARLPAATYGLVEVRPV